MNMRMECQPMFLTVYFSLLLMTAGFVLTLCAWLAPPLNHFVQVVRILGLIALLIGSIFLGCACLVGSLNRGKCFSFCYICKNKKRRDQQKYCATDIIANPIVVNYQNATATTARNFLEAKGAVQSQTEQNNLLQTVIVYKPDTGERQCVRNDSKLLKDYGSCDAQTNQVHYKAPEVLYASYHSTENRDIQSYKNINCTNENLTGNNRRNMLHSNETSCSAINSDKFPQHSEENSTEAVLENYSSRDVDCQHTEHASEDVKHKIEQIRVLKAFDREPMSYDNLPIYQLQYEKQPGNRDVVL